MDQKTAAHAIELLGEIRQFSGNAWEFNAKMNQVGYALQQILQPPQPAVQDQEPKGNGAEAPKKRAAKPPKSPTPLEEPSRPEA